MTQRNDFNGLSDQDILNNFDQNVWDNERLATAIRQEQSAPAIVLLKQEGFQLDPDIMIGDKNILMAAIDWEMHDVIELIFQQPKNILKRLLTFKNIHEECVFTSTINKNDVETMRLISQSDITPTIPTDDLEKLSRSSIDLVREASWNSDFMSRTVFSDLHFYFGYIHRETQNILTNSIKHQKWDNAKFFINHEAFDQSQSLATINKAIGLAKKYASKNDDAREVLEMLKTKKKAFKNQRTNKKILKP